MVAIRSERLVLRPLEAADAPALAGYRSDPGVARFQGWEAPFALEKAQALIAGLADPAGGEPGWSQWAIEPLEGGGIIGDIGVNLFEDRQQAEIGFTLAAGFQRQGYASEAVARMLLHLFSERGLHRVSAECDSRNLASIRLLERLGFRQEGHRRASTWSKGEWTDDCLYAVLADEWQPAGPRAS